MIVFWLPVTAGILAGCALGGHMSRLTALHLRAVPLLVVSALIQLVLVYAPSVQPEQGLDPMRVGLPLATLAVLGCALANRRLPGMGLVVTGTAANLLVIGANGGLMPTNAQALDRAGMVHALEQAAAHPGIRLPRSKDALVPEEQTRLPWLSDVLVSPPLPQPKVFSVGDLLIAGGIAYLAAQSVRGRLPEQVAGHAEPEQAGAAAMSDALHPKPGGREALAYGTRSAAAGHARPAGQRHLGQQEQWSAEERRGGGAWR